MLAAKQNRLATLVGTRTAGEVLGGANFKLPSGYVLRMPVAGWYTWHGDVENSPESLGAGVDTQLNRALEVVKSL